MYCVRTYIYIRITVGNTVPRAACLDSTELVTIVFESCSGIAWCLVDGTGSLRWWEGIGSLRWWEGTGSLRWWEGTGSLHWWEGTAW